MWTRGNMGRIVGGVGPGTVFVAGRFAVFKHNLVHFWEHVGQQLLGIRFAIWPAICDHGLEQQGCFH